MSNIGNNAAATIVETDTLAMIAEADNIVRSCTGPNCNVSTTTRTNITRQLSTLAQNQAQLTFTLFSIPSSSVLGRNIYNAYLELGSAVSSVYNFQCGNNTTNSVNCVTNASSVQIAQNNLQSLLIQPAVNEVNHVVILSILLSIGIISFILFFVFLIIGLFDQMLEASELGLQSYPLPADISPTYMQHIQEQTQVPIIQAQPLSQQVVQTTVSPVIQSKQVAIPASPFDTTDPVYK